MSSALSKDRGTPFLGPTRLAVGLELEVFYVSLLEYEPLTMRPGFAYTKRWFPRVTCAPGTGTSADKFSTSVILLRGNQGINLLT